MKHRTLSRRAFITRAAAAAAALTLPFIGDASAQTSRRKPNIVFILADDLGWRDTTPFGSTFHGTPNIDRLVKRGMMFTQAYAANPLCSPTRSSIMTGLWPARIGITTPVCHVKEEKLEETLFTRASVTQKVLQAASATRLKLEYITLAESLKDAGYTTGHFGKWHLGPEPYDPLHQGFDADVPHYSGPGPAGSYLAPWKFPDALKFTGKTGEHIEDRMADEAVKFITANKDRPFFLNYWAFSVHSPWQAKDEYMTEYAKKADPSAEQKNPVYAGMLKSFDDAVGTLLKTLDDLKLADDTIIIFFSDNGGVNWHEDTMKTKYGMDVPPTSNSPLRAGKASIYEGGTRVPCAVVWPGVIRPGTKSDAVIQSIDFHPTILDMLGLNAKPEQKFDGISIVLALKGAVLSREAIFCHFPHYMGHHHETPSAYVRKGDWKLIRFFHDKSDLTDRHELYNLKDDISEQRDLAEQMPARVTELGMLLNRFLADSGAVIPKINPDYQKNPPLWLAGGTATAVVSGNVLNIVSSGKDPQLVLRDAIDLPQGSYTVQFRMKSASAGDGGLYWSSGRLGFARERLKVFTPVHDGVWHDYTLAIPAKTAITTLRLDPSSAPGDINLQWIRLMNADGTPVKKWEFSAASGSSAHDDN
ncbi:MAG: sulfatase [Spirochaetes bacterium]|nr:sulfatase [Spirochaetota bacterium]